MTDLEQLRRQALQALSYWGREASNPATTQWRARSITAAALVASIGAYALVWDVPGWIQVVLLVAAAAALWGRSHVPAFVVLIWGWAALLFEELQWEGRIYPQDRLFLEDWLGATALLAFLMFAFRLVELPREKIPSLTRLTTLAGSRKHTPNVLLFPFSGAALRLALAPAIAAAILWLIPWRRFRPNELQLYAPFYRAILFLWGIGVIGFLAATAFSILRWRRLSPRQGAIYARWVVLNESRREQAAIERARARLLRKR